MARTLLILVLAGAPFLIAGCNESEDPVPYRPPIEQHAVDEVEGGTLYLRDCAWCHGNDGDGTEYGPSIQESGEAGVHFYLSTGRMPLEDPRERAERGDAVYTQEEIDEIVEYTSTFSDGPAAPEVHLDSGEYDLGADLYLDNCAACHSSTGAGAILTSGIRVPDLFEATPQEVAEAIVAGPSNMPSFSYDERELDSVVRYVAALQDTPDRGGNSLGKLGPFSEGAVAWIVGLGGLLLVVRWIGSRAGE